MGLRLLLAPSVALVIMGGWICVQRDDIKRAAERRDELRAASSRGMNSRAPGLGGIVGDRVDWKNVAEQTLVLRGSNEVGALRSKLALRQRLDEMSPDQLVEAMDEIAQLGIAEREQRELERLILGSLMEKDARGTLMRYSDRLHGGKNGLISHLHAALGGWAKTDPAAAARWLDEQIASNIFEGDSLYRDPHQLASYEGAVISAMLRSDSASAIERISRYADETGNQKRAILSKIGIQEVNAEYYLNTVRAVHREGRVPFHIPGMEKLMEVGGYERVDKFLTEAGASSQERQTVVEGLVRSEINQMIYHKMISSADIESMRQHVGTRAPDSVDKLSGEFLAALMNQPDREGGFAEAARLAIQYQQETGTDGVIPALLADPSAKGHRDEALPLIHRISDPEQREKILKAFGGGVE